MKSRLLLAFLGCLAAGLVAWQAAPWLRARLGSGAPALKLIENEEALSDEFAARLAALEARSPSIPIQAFPDTTLVRARLSQPIMERLYVALRIGQYPYDPVRDFRRHKDRVERFPWPEHPDGEWTMRTNSEGLRMDAERGPGPYLAVIGDSHMDGACNNPEATAGLLGSALADERPDLQVVNVSCGGYSFHQYLGALEFLCGDEPGTFVDPQAAVPVEAMVVFVYGGNDFVEVLRLAHQFNGTERPDNWGRENERLAPWRQSHPAAIGQALNSIVYFRNSPSEVGVALAEGVAVVEELQRHASRRGFRLAIAYLPSALEVERALHPDAFEAPIAALDITPTELSYTWHMTDRFLADVRALGVEALDLRPTLSSGGPYYWDYDLHLNLQGHARVTERLLEWFRSLPQPTE